MSRMTFKISGLERLTRKLESAARRSLLKHARPVIKKYSPELVLRARTAIVEVGAVDTGTLKDAIAEGKIVAQRHRITGAIGIAKTESVVAKTWGKKTYMVKVKPYKYAHLVELGFKHAKTGQQIPGRSFLKRAAEQVSESFYSDMAKAINDAMKEWAASGD